MKSLLGILTVGFVLIACNTETSKEPEKAPILKANREAPLGWVYLEIFEDSTFIFTLTGLRDATNFPGKATIVNDTVYFEYTDSVPKAGRIAIIQDDYISYIAGEYGESMGITFNKLEEPNIE